MKIGIIGAGNIGSELAQGWSALGHEVLVGVRDTNGEKAQKVLAATAGKVKLTSVREAATFGEVVVIAVPWGSVRDALAQAGDLAGKIVIDPTNRFIPPAADDGPSLAETIARLAPGSRVVKAYSTTPSAQLLQPLLEGKPVTVFMASDDAEAKQTVSDLSKQLGLDPVDVGALSVAAHIEGMVYVIAGAASHLSWNIGFRLMRG
jgi:8-hydroxy-5-deazaflavin:NADPH oxidoreductase